MRIYAGKWSLWAGSICVFWINLPITVFFDCGGRGCRGCGSVVAQLRRGERGACRFLILFFYAQRLKALGKKLSVDEIEPFDVV